MILFVPNSLTRLLELAEGQEVAPGIRIQAATIGSMVADNDYDLETIQRLHSMSIEQPVEDPDDVKAMLLLSLVFHTSIGDPRVAVECARSYSDLCRSSPDKREMIHGLRRAANALIRVGEYRSAECLLLEALDFTVHRKLAAQTFACSDLLASAHLHSGDLAGAVSEVERQQAILSQGGSVIQSAMLHYTQSMLAWLSCDVQSARALLEVAPTAPPNWLRASRFCSGIGTVAAQLLVEPGRLSRECVDRMHDLYLLGRSLGRQDINTSIMWTALNTVGRGEDANRLSAEYGSLRREQASAVNPMATTYALQRVLK